MSHYQRSWRCGRSYSKLDSRDRARIRRQYVGEKVSRCLGIFGLNTSTTRETLYNIFSKFGPIDRIQMVNFTNTHISRGFCFIYFKHVNDARLAKKDCSHRMEVDGRRIRADYSVTKRAHTPTPGVYMGRPSRPHYEHCTREINWNKGSRRASSQRGQDQTTTRRSYSNYQWSRK